MCLKHQCFPKLFHTETPKIIVHAPKNLAYENTDRPENVYIYMPIHIKTQGSTDFPKIYMPPQIFVRQKDDMK